MCPKYAKDHLHRKNRIQMAISASNNLIESDPASHQTIMLQFVSVIFLNYQVIKNIRKKW